MLQLGCLSWLALGGMFAFFIAFKPAEFLEAYHATSANPVLADGPTKALIELMIKVLKLANPFPLTWAQFFF